MLPSVRHLAAVGNGGVRGGAVFCRCRGALPRGQGGVCLAEAATLQLELADCLAPPGTQQLSPWESAASAADEDLEHLDSQRRLSSQGASSTTSRMQSCSLLGPSRPAVVSQAVPIGRGCRHSPSTSGQGMFVGEEALTSRSSPARQAWNKGQTVAAAIRLKISQSQQARWRNNPGVREAVQAKLKGKVPWNKGRKLSEETRQKMREAKLNSTHSRRVRNKMSRAHTGKQHTPETAALLSDRLSGVPKSDAHKEKIAAAQRRRHAAARILRAVEAVHMESSAEAGGSDDGRLPGHAFGTGGPGSAGAARLTRAQVLSGYKAQLREYRALQEELSPWTAAFKAQHDRKPRLSDVECTGIPWLINRYKRYVVLRERLLNDTHILRDKLTGARPDAAAPTMGANGAAMRPLQLEKLNANGSASGRGEGASRMASALEYKRSRAAPSRAAAGAAAITTSAASTRVAALDDSQVLADAAGFGQDGKDENMLADTSPSSPSSNGTGSRSFDGPGVARTANGMSSSGRNREGGDSPGEAMAEFRPLDGVPYTAPPRVRSAMAAAIEYRQKKATETAAAASTAASKAAARPVKARRVRAKGAATILTGKAFESTHAASAEPGAASDMKGSAEPSDGTAATSKPGGDAVRPESPALLEPLSVEHQLSLPTA